MTSRNVERAPRKRMRTRVALACAAALLLCALPPTIRYARSAALLTRVIDPKAEPAPLLSYAVEAVDTTVHAGSEVLRGRSYLPTGAPSAPGLVLLHGVHPSGIDEPRLVAFARSLAAVGVHVLTPELPELLEYRIEAGTVERIADVARAHAERVGTRTVGVVGISFAGGLALMAADHARAAASIGFVVTLGAHHDLWRLTHFYAGHSIQGPNGEPTEVRPHPYGARVLLRQHLHRLFAREDLALARTALDLYLRDEHTRARQVARGLSTAGRITMDVLLDGSRQHELGKLLMNAARSVRAQLDAASPHGHLSHVTAPVFLIHGLKDPVIPSTETLWLAQELPAGALRKTVITPLLRHAEFPERPKLSDMFELLSLMADVLAHADATRFRSPRTVL